MKCEKVSLVRKIDKIERLPFLFDISVREHFRANVRVKKSCIDLLDLPPGLNILKKNSDHPV
jgi:hypothetical protein